MWVISSMLFHDMSAACCLLYHLPHVHVVLRAAYHSLGSVRRHICHFGRFCTVLLQHGCAYCLSASPIHDCMSKSCHQQI